MQFAHIEGRNSTVTTLQTATARRRRSNHGLNLVLMVVLFSASASVCFGADAPASTNGQEAKLVAILNSDASQKDKADACRELARVGTEKAVPALVALLADEKLSHMARYGLETIPSPAVDKALRDALGRLQGEALVGVIGSIGVRRDEKAVNQLVRLLQHSEPDVAQAAARALGRIGDLAAARGLRAAMSQVAAANQLALCEGLLRCAEALTTKGNVKEAITIYDRLCASQVPHQVHTAALREAVLTRPKGGLVLLLAAVRSHDFTLFAAAMRISQEMKGPEVTRALAAQFERLDENQQILLVQTLAARGDLEGLPAVLAAAKDAARPVRIAAVRVLPEFGSPLALPTLMESLGSSNPDMTQAARDSLAALPGDEVNAALLGLLRGPDPERCILALDLVVRRRMTKALPDVLKAADSSDSKVRIAAAQRLGELGGPAEIPACLALLTKATDPLDLEAREQALAALCVKQANPQAADSTVQTQFASAQPAQKCALLRVLGAVGGTSALGRVRAAANDPNAEVRSAAIRVLGSWNSADAAPDLLELAQSLKEPTDKTICVRGYLGFAGQHELAAEKRLQMCRDAQPLVQTQEEKKLLLAALGSIPSGDALTQIMPYLDDPATREEASSAVVTVADTLLKGNDSGRTAPQLVQPLDKVVQTATNAELTERAKKLLEQARSKTSST